jgi:hypothetical protein
MHIRFEELQILGGMGIMAFPTIHDSRFDIKVCLAERPFSVIMAFTAQRLNGLVHQSRLC